MNTSRTLQPPGFLRWFEEVDVEEYPRVCQSTDSKRTLLLVEGKEMRVVYIFPRALRWL